MLFFLISFLAGVLTILAPCVLPVLPVIIGGSVQSEGRRSARPYVIGASLAVSIILFTLVLKVSAVLTNLPAGVLNWVSGALLIGLGVVSLVPELWDQLMIRVGWQAASERLLDRGAHNRNAYVSAVLV